MKRRKTLQIIEEEVKIYLMVSIKYLRYEIDWTKMSLKVCLVT